MQMREAKIVPVVGHTLEVSFGDFVFHTSFDSERQLTFIPVQGGLGCRETVNNQKVDIGPNAYLLLWQEHGKSAITRYWDFGKEIVYSNVTLPDNTFLSPKGTLEPIG